MEGLSQYSTQVANVLILLDVVRAMLLSIYTKYKTKKLVARVVKVKKPVLRFIAWLMILLKELIIFLASFL